MPDFTEVQVKVRFGRLCAAMSVVAVALCVASVSQGAVNSIAVGTYQTNGRVEQIVISGDTAYLVGKFTSVRPAGAALGTGEVARNNAAAVSLSTGALLPWNPNANNTVQTAVVNGSTVYLGGLFTTIGGKNSSHLAAVDATTGAVVSAWKGSANGQVMSLALGNGVLYAGGQFTTAKGGTARNHLAAFDLTAGNLTAWAPSADNTVNSVAVSADGTHVFVGGTFQHIGTSLQRYLAALDPSTGAPLAWAAHPTAAVVDMAVDSTGVYVASTGSNGGNGGQVLAFNPSTGAQNWIGGMDGNVQAVAILNGLVYVGGHFANYCGAVPGSNVCRTPTVRNHLLALTEQSGALDAWHPSANGDLGVFAVAGSGGNLAIGGDFTKAGSVNQQGFAEFTTITDPTVSDTAGGQPTTAGSVTVNASGSTDSGPGFVGYRYQTSTDNGTTWSVSHNVASATVSTVGTTLVRFQAYDAAGNTSNWITDTVVIQSSGTGSAQITFAASGTATVGSSGNVTVKGTYTCTGASSITISGSVTQAATGATGTFTATVPCGVTTSTKWSAVAKHTGSVVFAAGTASETVAWSATDSVTNQPLGTSQTRSITISYATNVPARCPSP